MKHRLRAFAVLLVTLAALPLGAAEDRGLIDQVIRLHKAGVAGPAIVKFVHDSYGRFDVTAGDLITLTDAGVPAPIVQAVLDRSVASVADTPHATGRPYYRGPFWYDPMNCDPCWYGPRLSASMGLGFYPTRYGGRR